MSIEIGYNISRIGRYSFNLVDIIEVVICKIVTNLEYWKISKTVRDMITICPAAIQPRNVTAVKEVYRLESDFERHNIKNILDK